MHSVDGQLHQHQHEQPDIWSRPCPLRRAVEIRPPLFDLTIKRNTREVNVRRAEKLPLFPGYYFLIMSAFSGARVEQPFST